MWIDPRAELPDSDILVQTIVSDRVGGVEVINMVYESENLWRDECNQPYATLEIRVWRHLHVSESE